jgi:hypothetical protein
MSSHFQDGIGRGWRVPAGLRCSAFTLWQISHSATYWATSIFMWGHQDFFLTSWYILLHLGWIQNWDSWASARIFCLGSKCLGTTKRFPNQTVPSSSMVNSLASPLIFLARIFHIPSFPFWASLILLIRLEVITREANDPCSTMERLSFRKSSQSVSTPDWACKQLQCAFRLNASATTS